MSAKPKTLQQAMVYFADVDNGLKFMVACRWPNGVECPACGRDDVRFISTRRMWTARASTPRNSSASRSGLSLKILPCPWTSGSSLSCAGSA